MRARMPEARAPLGAKLPLVTDCGFPWLMADGRRWTEDRRLKTEDCRMPIAERGLRHEGFASIYRKEDWRSARPLQYNSGSSKMPD